MCNLKHNLFVSVGFIHISVIIRKVTAHNYFKLKFFMKKQQQNINANYACNSKVFREIAALDNLFIL